MESRTLVFDVRTVRPCLLRQSETELLDRDTRKYARLGDAFREEAVKIPWCTFLRSELMSQMICNQANDWVPLPVFIGFADIFKGREMLFFQSDIRFFSQPLENVGILGIHIQEVVVIG